MRAEQNMAIQGGGAEFRSGCTATAATFHLGPCDLFQKPHELSYSGGFSGGERILATILDKDQN